MPNLPTKRTSVVQILRWSRWRHPQKDLIDVYVFQDILTLYNLSNAKGNYKRTPLNVNLVIKVGPVYGIVPNKRQNAAEQVRWRHIETISLMRNMLI